jgi:hypothetical protein
MAKFTIGLICLTRLISTCSEKKESHKNTMKFKSFEIGYTNGWTHEFSFWMDSNKIFLSPQKFDTIKYGILPDSISRLIDTTLLKIISDTTVKSKDDGCEDCAIIALQAIIGTDTISIHQIGDIDKRLWPVIRTLQYFVDSNNHPTMHAILFLETQKAVFPPPPPLLNNRKFLPSDIKTKRGM